MKNAKKIDWLCWELAHEIKVNYLRTPCYMYDYYPAKFNDCMERDVKEEINVQECAECLKNNLEEAMRND